MNNEIIAQILGTTRQNVLRMKKSAKHESMFKDIEELYLKGIVDISCFIRENYRLSFMPSPIKWVGGKKQIIGKILNEFPDDIDTYFEPFVGGAVVANNVKAKKKKINDINKELTNFYSVIKTEKNSLLEYVDIHKYNLSKLGGEYYYTVRMWDRLPNWQTRSDLERASRFLFLNKSSFNGLWRENLKGQNNSPWNKKRDINFYQYDVVDYFVKTLNNTDIYNLDFDVFLRSANKRDFIYLDPPYDIEDNINEFTSYNSGGFDRFEQERLLKTLQQLNKKGVRWVMSNSNTQWIQKAYKEFTIKPISTRVSINSNGNNRKKNDNEVIIKNF